jgi:hypothetical protein
VFLCGFLIRMLGLLAAEKLLLFHQSSGAISAKRVAPFGRNQCNGAGALIRDFRYEQPSRQRDHAVAAQALAASVPTSNGNYSGGY